MINKHILSLQSYSSSSHKIRELAEEHNISKLDWNESTRINDKLQQHLADFILHGQFQFYPNTYNKNLFEKLSQYTHSPIDTILYFNGSDDGLDNIASLWVEENTVVGTIKPSYDNFRIFVEKRWGIMKYLISDPFYKKPSVKEIKKFLLENNIDVFYLISPHNPLGYSFTQDEIQELITTTPNVNFIVDHAYLEFEGVKFDYWIFEQQNNVIFARTFSKALGIAGLRFWYIITSQTVITNIKTYRNPKSINIISQEAAMFLLQHYEDIDDYIDEVHASYGILTNFLQQRNIDFLPSKANFLLIQVDESLKIELRDYLERHFIFIRFLGDPLLKDWVRVTLWGQKHIQNFIEHFANFLDAWKD